MSSDVPEASAASAIEDEVQGKLAAICLSTSTDRAELWRAQGITFRPYRDESDMVGSNSAFANAFPFCFFILKRTVRCG